MSFSVGGGSWDAEIGWTLVQYNTIVASGGAGEQLVCDLSGCYTLDMTDSYGDGWNGATYTLTDDAGNILASGDLDTAVEGDGITQGSDFIEIGGSCGLGCTDSSACNYDADATVDDGSCDNCSCTDDCILGCILPSACNFNPLATSGSAADCNWSCYTACQDPNACNYTPAVSGPNYELYGVASGDPSWMSYAWNLISSSFPGEFTSAGFSIPWSSPWGPEEYAVANWLMAAGDSPSPYGGGCYYSENLQFDLVSCQCASEYLSSAFSNPDFQVQTCSDASVAWASHGTGSNSVTIYYPCTETAFYDGGTGSNNITIYIPSGVQEFFLRNSTGTNVYNVYYNSETTSFSHYFATGSPSLNLYGDYDGVCSGCSDPAACNFVEGVTEPNLEICNYTSCQGCTDPLVCNYDEFATVDDGSCTETTPGCTDVHACNFDPLADCDNNFCDYNSCVNFGCLDTDACNYDSTAQADDGTCTYSAFPYDCDGSCLLYDECGVCGGDNSSCSGCTHENATNYDSTATIEDGSCLYSQDAYDAGYEAGAASAECPPCANSDCPGDFTADGYIGVDDILAMLSLYDTSCSE